MEKILIIDDTWDFRGMLGDALESAGYCICTAGGVASGIAGALDFQPDLVLCDVVLGDGNGFDILAALQQHPSLQRVPFIFMSGEAIASEDVRKGMLNGADDYLIKPFPMAELMTAITARLERVRRLSSPSVSGMASCFAGSSEALQDWLEQLSRQDSPFCLLAIGLHRFERFWRLFGWHESGQMLQALVERLLALLESSAPQAFMAHEPDKFYLLWQGPFQPAAARSMAQRLLAGLAQPQEWREHVLRLGAQAGVVLGPMAEATGRADLALHRAETRGAGSVVFFEPSMEQELKLHFRWEEELGTALEQKRFELYYQPQFELKSRQLCGAEALLRLHHPQLGLVLPAAFIPVAEEYGLMEPIGQWALERACRQIRQWEERDGVRLRVAVNVSQIQFLHHDFAATVAGILTRTGSDSQSLELELTESMLMQDPPRTLEQLRALKDLGLSLAMDDFGTGYSSLASLGQMPFDLVKIDQSFVRRLGTLPGSQAIPRAIVEMGHSLGMKILAEGIENETQLELLSGMGCDFGQGFLFARPVPAGRMAAFFTPSMARR